MRTTTRSVIFGAAIALVAGACVRASGGGSAAWATSFHHALSESTHDRRPVFVYYANDWDPWCHRMDQETFADREVRTALAGFHLIRIDPSKDPDVANKYDVYLCPSFVIVDHRGDEIFHVTGFRTPAQLLREFARARASGGGAR